MTNKIRVLPIGAACDCPFYLQDTKGNQQCLFKSLVTLPVLKSMVEDNPEWEDDIWHEDCHGYLSQCTVAPMLYIQKPVDGLLDYEANHFNAFEGYPEYGSTEEEKQMEIDEYAAFAQAAEQANNVYIQQMTEETQDNSELIESVNNETKQPEINDAIEDTSSPKENEEQQIATIQKIENIKDNVIASLSKKRPKIVIQHIETPYRVKTDFLVFPVDNTLLIDDKELIKHTGEDLNNQILKLYKNIDGNIKVGMVYPFENNFSNTKLSAKKLILSVVAGLGMIAKPEGVRQTTTKSLMIASLTPGAKTIVFIPPDKGTLDLGTCAREHLGTIKEFINRADTGDLTHIYIIMDDELTEDCYREYYERIFPES